MVKTSKDADWDHFLADLPATQCRWAVYDLIYAVSGVQQSKMLFIDWYFWLHFYYKHNWLMIERRRAPSQCRVRQLMTYASAKDTLKRALVGITVNMQASGKNELSLVTGAVYYQFLFSMLFMTSPAAVLNKVSPVRRHSNDF